MHKFPLCGEMAPEDERDLIEAVVTCEGNLHDPDFSDRFQSIVSKLKSILYTTNKKQPLKVRKIEPWNSVRVTISIPKEAAQRLRLLAQQGSNVLRQLGILSVQVEGDQVISLTLAGRYNEPQEVILRQSNEAANSSASSSTSSLCTSTSVASTSSVPTPIVPVAGPSGVMVDILSSSTSSAFRSPNVVAPSGESIPFPPKNAAVGPRATLGGPFPFASMTHAAHTMQRSETSSSSTQIPSVTNSTNSSPTPTSNNANAIPSPVPPVNPVSVTSGPLGRNNSTKVTVSPSTPPPTLTPQLSAPGRKNNNNSNVNSPNVNVVSKPQPVLVTAVVNVKNNNSNNNNSSNNISSSQNNSNNSTTNSSFIPPSNPPNVVVVVNSTNFSKPAQVQGDAKLNPSQQVQHLHHHSKLQTVLKTSSTGVSHPLGRDKEPTSPPVGPPGNPQLTSSGKPRQFLINPLTGHLEPMPSESSSESEGDEDENGVVSTKVSHLLKSSKGKDNPSVTVGWDKLSLPPPKPVKITLDALKINRVPGTAGNSAPVISARKSREELEVAPTLAKENSIAYVNNTNPVDKIKKLRLKLEKTESLTPAAYKMDVAYVKKSEKSSVSTVMSSGGASASLGGQFPSNPSSTVSSGFPSVQPALQAQSDVPRVPPLHISLRGKNAAVVVSPRRDDNKDFPNLSSSPTSLSSHNDNKPVVVSVIAPKSQVSASRAVKRTKTRLKSSDDPSHVDGSVNIKKTSKIIKSRPVSTASTDECEDPLKARLKSEEKLNSSSFLSDFGKPTINKSTSVSDLISGNPGAIPVSVNAMSPSSASAAGVTSPTNKIKKHRRKSEMSSRQAFNSSQSYDKVGEVLPPGAESSQLKKLLSQQVGVKHEEDYQQIPSTVAAPLMSTSMLGTISTSLISCDRDKDREARMILSSVTSVPPAPPHANLSTSDFVAGTSMPDEDNVNTPKDEEHTINSTLPLVKVSDIPKLNEGSSVEAKVASTTIPDNTNWSKSCYEKAVPGLVALPLLQSSLDSNKPEMLTSQSLLFSLSSSPISHQVSHLQTPTSLSTSTTQSSTLISGKGLHNPGFAATTANSVGFGGITSVTQSAIVSRSVSELVTVTPVVKQFAGSHLRISGDTTPGTTSSVIDSTVKSLGSSILNQMLTSKEPSELIRPGSTAIKLSTTVSSVVPLPITPVTTSTVNLTTVSSALLLSKVQTPSSSASSYVLLDEQASPPSKLLCEMIEPVEPSEAVLYAIATKSPSEIIPAMSPLLEQQSKTESKFSNLDDLSTGSVAVLGPTLDDNVEEHPNIGLEICEKIKPCSSLVDNTEVLTESDMETDRRDVVSSPTTVMAAPSISSQPLDPLPLRLMALSLPSTGVTASSLSGGVKPDDQSGIPGEDSGIDSMDALSEKSPNQGESPARKNENDHHFCDNSTSAHSHSQIHHPKNSPASDRTLANDFENGAHLTGVESSIIPTLDGNSVSCREYSSGNTIGAEVKPSPSAVSQVVPTESMDVDLVGPVASQSPVAISNPASASISVTTADDHKDVNRETSPIRNKVPLSIPSSILVASSSGSSTLTALLTTSEQQKDQPSLSEEQPLSQSRVVDNSLFDETDTFHDTDNTMKESATGDNNSVEVISSLKPSSPPPSENVPVISCTSTSTTSLNPNSPVVPVEPSISESLQESLSDDKGSGELVPLLPPVQNPPLKEEPLQTEVTPGIIISDTSSSIPDLTSSSVSDNSDLTLSNLSELSVVVVKSETCFESTSSSAEKKESAEITLGSGVRQMNEIISGEDAYSVPKERVSVVEPETKPTSSTGLSDVKEKDTSANSAIAEEMSKDSNKPSSVPPDLEDSAPPNLDISDVSVSLNEPDVELLRSEVVAPEIPDTSFVDLGSAVDPCSTDSKSSLSEFVDAVESMETDEKQQSLENQEVDIHESNLQPASKNLVETWTNVEVKADSREDATVEETNVRVNKNQPGEDPGNSDGTRSNFTLVKDEEPQLQITSILKHGLDSNTSIVQPATEGNHSGVLPMEREVENRELKLCNRVEKTEDLTTSVVQVHNLATEVPNEGGIPPTNLQTGLPDAKVSEPVPSFPLISSCLPDTPEVKLDVKPIIVSATENQMSTTTPAQDVPCEAPSYPVLQTMTSLSSSVTLLNPNIDASSGKNDNEVNEVTNSVAVVKDSNCNQQGNDLSIKEELSAISESKEDASAAKAGIISDTQHVAEKGLVQHQSIPGGDVKTSIVPTLTAVPTKLELASNLPTYTNLSTSVAPSVSTVVTVPAVTTLVTVPVAVTSHTPTNVVAALVTQANLEVVNKDVSSFMSTTSPPSNIMKPALKTKEAEEVKIKMKVDASTSTRAPTTTAAIIYPSKAFTCANSKEDKEKVQAVVYPAPNNSSITMMPHLTGENKLFDGKVIKPNSNLPGRGSRKELLPVLIPAPNPLRGESHLPSFHSHGKPQMPNITPMQKLILTTADSASITNSTLTNSMVAHALESVVTPTVSVSPPSLAPIVIRQNFHSPIFTLDQQHGKQNQIPNRQSIEMSLPSKVEVKPNINAPRVVHPNVIQLTKAAAANLSNKGIAVTGAQCHPVVSKSSPISVSLAPLTSSTALANATGTPTVFAIHPQYHHQSAAITMLPGGKMVKLVTIPKQNQSQLPLQGVVGSNRSSPTILETVNIVAASSRSSSPNSPVNKPKVHGNAVQNSPLNLSSVTAGNLHLVPISVSSATTGTSSPVKVLVSPVKMQSMMVKGQIVMASQNQAHHPTTIRVVRPIVSKDMESPKLELVENKKGHVNLEHARAVVDAFNRAQQQQHQGQSSNRVDAPGQVSMDKNSIYEGADGVQVLDTEDTNEDDLFPFEADIIHDEKDLADVLADEKVRVSENGIDLDSLDGPYEDEHKDDEGTEKSPTTSGPHAFENFSGVKDAGGGSTNTSLRSSEETTTTTPTTVDPSDSELDKIDSPIPAIRASSPLYTYSNRSARNSHSTSESRSPSPPEPDVHGEDQEIIDCLSRSPSQPKLSPQNKPLSAVENDNDYGSPTKPDLHPDHTYVVGSAGGDNSSAPQLEQLSIEIPPVDLMAMSPATTEEGRKHTRSTRSNTRLVSPDITAFRSDTPKPTKFTNKPDALVLRSSPKPSPTGSIKTHSPGIVGIQPCTSARASPVPNQLLVNSNSGIHPVTGRNSPIIASSLAARGAGGSTAFANKRKRQESDSSNASRDENTEETKVDIDLNSRPGKRKCSENAAELIKACIGVEDTPKRNSSLIKKQELQDSKAKDAAAGKGKKPTMSVVVEEKEDDLESVDILNRGRSGGRSSRGSSEDRSSSRGSSVHRNTVTPKPNTKEEENKDAKSNSRMNNRTVGTKEMSGKSKPSGRDSPSSHLIKKEDTKQSSVGRRSNRNAPTKEKSPLTLAKTRTNVRKEPLASGIEKSTTPTTSPENGNPRRKTRSSVAVGPSDLMPSFKRRRISKDAKS